MLFRHRSRHNLCRWKRQVSGFYSFPQNIRWVLLSYHARWYFLWLVAAILLISFLCGTITTLPYSSNRNQKVGRLSQTWDFLTVWGFLVSFLRVWWCFSNNTEKFKKFSGLRFRSNRTLGQLKSSPLWKHCFSWLFILLPAALARSRMDIKGKIHILPTTAVENNGLQSSYRFFRGSVERQQWGQATCHITVIHGPKKATNFRMNRATFSL